MNSPTSPYVLGVDIGSTSLRVGLFSLSGALVASATQSVKLNRPREGWVEVDADEYWNALVYCIRKAIPKAHAPHIQGITIGSTASTILGVTKDGIPCTSVMLWMDTRAISEAQELSMYLQEYTSHEWMPAKVLWLWRHRIEVWKQLGFVVELADWINFRLTGIWGVSRCTTVCKWNSLAIHSHDNTGCDTQNPTSTDLAVCMEKWPREVFDVGAPIGPLTPISASQLGLAENVVVCEGGIDAYMAMVGNNCMGPGSLSLTLGTSTVLLAPSVHPRPSHEIWGPFDSPLLRGQWVVEGGQLSSGILLDWLAKLLRTSQRDLTRAAKTVRPGAEGLVWSENIQGNRTPYRNALARGGLHGIRVDHGPAVIYRAAMEATAMGAYDAFRSVASSVGDRITTIRVSGGGACDPVWRQIHADVFGQSLFFPEEPQWASLRGAAVLAATGLHYYPDVRASAESMAPPWLEVFPNEENHAIYEQLLAVHTDAYRLETAIEHQQTVTVSQEV